MLLIMGVSLLCSSTAERTQMNVGLQSPVALGASVGGEAAGKRWRNPVRMTHIRALITGLTIALVLLIQRCFYTQSSGHSMHSTRRRLAVGGAAEDEEGDPCEVSNECHYGTHMGEVFRVFKLQVHVQTDQTVVLVPLCWL